jgi:hypothetical protein
VIDRRCLRNFCRVSVLLLGGLAGCMMMTPQPRNYFIFFQAGSADLTPEARQIVTTAATAANQQMSLKLAVEGRADGGTAADAALADKRATAVLEALAESGVGANRMAKQPGAPPEGVTGVAAHQVIVHLAP